MSAISAGSRVLVLGALVLIGCRLAPAASEGPLPASTRHGFIDSVDARLAYRLDLPPRTGPVGAVVFGHGSGRTTRESCRFLADGFLQRGYATLCFDKRGVGESTGQYSGVGTRNSKPMFELLAADMAAAVRFVRALEGVDQARVGLVGVSQAGWIIPIAAATTQPAFMILLVGPTVSVGIENFYSDLVEKSTMPLEEAYARLPSFAGENGFDPRRVLESLNVPGLWLLGAEDRSIPTPATVAILDELVASNRRPFSRVVFPGVGHDLSAAPVFSEIDRWLQRTLR